MRRLWRPCDQNFEIVDVASVEFQSLRQVEAARALTCLLCPGLKFIGSPACTAKHDALRPSNKTITRCSLLLNQPTTWRAATGPFRAHHPPAYLQRRPALRFFPLIHAAFFGIGQDHNCDSSLSERSPPSRTCTTRAPHTGTQSAQPACLRRGAELICVHACRHCRRRRGRRTPHCLPAALAARCASPATM